MLRYHHFYRYHIRRHPHLALEGCTDNAPQFFFTSVGCSWWLFFGPLGHQTVSPREYLFFCILAATVKTNQWDKQCKDEATHQRLKTIKQIRPTMGTSGPYILVTLPWHLIFASYFACWVLMRFGPCRASR
jgi:hypothetical protein